MPGMLRAFQLALLWALIGGCAADAAQPPAGRPPAAQLAAPSAPDLEARAWPEADRLFHSDPAWLGGDAAVSVPLGPQRVLWLFGDSFVGRPGQVDRRGARMVRNSVAIQDGRAPERSRLTFHYGRGPDGQPGSFFPERGEEWIWPQQGVVVDGALTLFLYTLAGHGEGGLGFAYRRWLALRVDDFSGPPDGWRLRELPVPDALPIAMVGVSVLVQDAHVIAYGVREPGDHALFALRWSRANFAAGELRDPELWAGAARGWTRGPPSPVVREAQTELSVVPWAEGYLLVQTRGFGPAPIVVRAAPTPTGPFGPPREVYLPPEGARPSALIYAARAHPEQAGGGLALTYATNTLDMKTLLEDMDVYFPRFVRIEAPGAGR
jgi:hypothetical protein